MSIDVITRMRKLDGTFAKGEQRVADFVLGNLERVAHMRLSEVAESADVSVATVNRFCQTVGCGGFKDFKIIVAQSVAVSMQYLTTSGTGANADSATEQLVGLVFGVLAESLNTVRGQLQDDVITDVIRVIAKADRLVFFGLGGGSSTVAIEGANRFFRLGIHSEAHSDSYTQRMLAATLKEGDVLFAISSSGSPKALRDSAETAQQYGAKTISLTRAGSPLAQLTDLCIALDLPEHPDIYKPTASRLVMMAVMDVIATGVGMARQDIVKENLRRIRTSLVPLYEDVEPKPIGD